MFLTISSWSPPLSTNFFVLKSLIFCWIKSVCHAVPPIYLPPHSTSSHQTRFPFLTAPQTPNLSWAVQPHASLWLIQFSSNTLEATAYGIACVCDCTIRLFEYRCPQTNPLSFDHILREEPTPARARTTNPCRLHTMKWVLRCSLITMHVWFIW